MSAVTEANGIWTITAAGSTVCFDSGSFDFSMQRSGGRPWRMERDDSRDLTLRHGDTTTNVSLASAARREVREYATGSLRGIRVELRGFEASGRSFDVTIAIIVAIDILNGDVVTRIVPVSDDEKSLREMQYPRAFTLDAVGPGVYHVVPSRQGFLLPPDWPHPVDWMWIGLANTTGIYLPMWGAMRPGDSYVAILETPFDGGFQLDHPAGGPTRICTKWHPSLGSIRYARQIRFSLLEGSDYNDIIHRYREYVRADGRLKTLETKATEVPRVSELEGTTIATTHTLYHNQPDAHYYDPNNPERNHQLNPFADCAEGLQRFAKQYDSDRVVVHLDGWGSRGYDNLHPDIFPPCPEAGGWEGFKSVADVCDENGWLFATHDNYIDFYQDAASYTDDLAVWDENGDVPKKAWWAGGAQAFLCEQNALGYVQRNFEEILREGVKLTSTYIDVFSIVEPFECYHPDHPETREESIRARAACFNWVRSKGIVLSSEEPTDWSIPYIDFCYWAPLQQSKGLMRGELAGIPIPLFNGIYHDCIVTPWQLTQADEVSDVDQFLYALSFGGCPMVGNPDRKGAFPAGSLERAKILADVHRQTGFAPIERHELLVPDGSRRLTTFADGASVEIDLRKQQYRLEGLKRMKKKWCSVPGAKV